MLAGCSASTSSGRSTAGHGAEDGGEVAPAALRAAEGDPRLSWMGPPLPIAGRWKVAGCPGKTDMVIEIALPESKVAVAHVVEPGGATKYGYQRGERIFELEANLYGNWRGKSMWRSVTSAERWDPIYLTMDGDVLTATMTTDRCFNRLVRVQ